MISDIELILGDRFKALGRKFGGTVCKRYLCVWSARLTPASDARTLTAVFTLSGFRHRGTGKSEGVFFQKPNFSLRDPNSYGNLSTLIFNVSDCKMRI